MSPFSKEVPCMEMDIVSSAVAGLIAALTATIILGIAKWVRQWWVRQKLVNLRDVLSEGRKRVMEAIPLKATSRKSADVLRAAQYNNMIKKLGVALEKWMVNLPHYRKDVFDALDWYHTDSLQAIAWNKRCILTFPDGKWPERQCQWKWPKRNSMKLQSIKWLKLKAY